jgi:hypothetical protein
VRFVEAAKMELKAEVDVVAGFGVCSLLDEQLGPSPFWASIFFTNKSPVLFITPISAWEDKLG